MICYEQMKPDKFWFFDQKNTIFTWLPRTSMLGIEHASYHPNWAKDKATTSQLRQLVKVVWTVKRIEGYK